MYIPKGFCPEKTGKLVLSVELEVEYREGQDMGEVADQVHRQLRNSFFEMERNSSRVKWQAKSVNVSVSEVLNDE